MLTHPYVFKRDGVVVARLAANGTVTSNADGTGWYEYDSIGDFLSEAGLDIDPVNYVSQIAGVVAGVPEIDLSALQAAVPVPASAPVPVPVAAAPEPPKPKRGRKQKTDGNSDGVPETPNQVAPTPANVLMDPAVAAFIASQKAAAAAAATAGSGAGAAPAPVAAPPIPAPTPAPVPTPSPAPIPPPTPTTAAIDTQSILVRCIETHGMAAFAQSIAELLTARAASLRQFGMLGNAERFDATAAAFRDLSTWV